MKEDWDGSSLEEYVERMLRQGWTGIVKSLMLNMPEEKRGKYREIWKRVMAEKKAEGKEENEV